MMHLLPLKITDEQKKYLYDRKKKFEISVSAQIRDAIDLYIEKTKGE